MEALMLLGAFGYRLNWSCRQNVLRTNTHTLNQSMKLPFRCWDRWDREGKCFRVSFIWAATSALQFIAAGDLSEGKSWGLTGGLFCGGYFTGGRLFWGMGWDLGYGEGNILQKQYWSKHRSSFELEVQRVPTFHWILQFWACIWVFSTAYKRYSQHFIMF